MSTQNLSPIAGLAAPGLLWLATSVALGQVAPPPQGPATNPAPTSTSSTYAVLLMSNGTVVRGEIVEDPQAGVYRLRCKGGQVPYPKTAVKKAAGSLEELYQYQVACLPPGDPDERMKLVRWCLTEHLKAQAREQLAAVRAMCPDDAEARRMEANLAANVEADGRLDPDVRRTVGEMPRAEAPAALDPRILVKVRRDFGRNALPVIFDLPPAQAVSRAADFARYVQPVLQQNCSGCHSERYQGEFQLVEARLPKDLRNPDVARANLDATLRLVNPDDPTRSDLLSAGLVPHGPIKGAIFKGPNDPQYHILATWVRSLRPAPAPAAKSAADGVARTGFNAAEPASGDDFGADRPGRAAPAATSTLPPLPARPVRRMPGNPGGMAQTPPPLPMPRSASTFAPGTSYNETGEGVDFEPAVGKDFPLPFAVGGAPSSRPVPPPRRRPAAGAPGRDEPNEAAEATPDPNAVRPTTATEVAPGTVLVGPTEDPNKLPGMNQKLYPSLTKKGDPAKKKKTQLDPALLEKMIKSRNGNP